jgi:uncharacterized protein YjhX (UPF0386 family)
MTKPDDPRIGRLYGGDCFWALAALITLWATIAFVFFGVCSVCSDQAIRAALAGGAGILLILNTASIIALVRHYTRDKYHLYGLDLFYVDTMRQAKREGKI